MCVHVVIAVLFCCIRKLCQASAGRAAAGTRLHAIFGSALIIIIKIPIILWLLLCFIVRVTTFTTQGRSVSFHLQEAQELAASWHSGQGCLLCLPVLKSPIVDLKRTQSFSSALDKCMAGPQNLLLSSPDGARFRASASNQPKHSTDSGSV